MAGMDVSEKDGPTASHSPRLARAVAKRFVSVLLGFLAWGALLFGSAGRLDWTRAWVYLGVSVLIFLGHGVLVIIKNPEAIVARAEIRKGTKAFDKVVLVPYAMAYLSVPVLAGLDAVRFGWSPMPFEALYGGLALLLLGFIPIASAMATNPYIEQTVRIQEDRGHKPATTGPYRIVRHPMYVGMILLHLSAPLALGSVWAFAPAGALVLLLIIRTAFEDRTLRRELPGYEEYAQRTRFRLLPGIW